jgi:Putative motility protein
MSISSVGNGADLLGVVSQLAQRTTAQDAGISVLKTALDASASSAADLASLVAQTTGSGSLLNAYA